MPPETGARGSAPPSPPPAPARLQCSTGPFWPMELEQALDILAEAGFSAIELMVTRDPRTQDPDIPATLAAERGLRIAALHGPFLAITKNVWGLDPLGKIHRGVEMCRALGATSQIVHPPFLWEAEYARWVKEECAEYSKNEGVVVAVETMYPKWVAGRRLRAYRWLEPASLFHHSPHVVLDTSHLAVGRKDILDAYHVLAPKLTHIHLSNNAGDGKDGHLEIERGILPIDRFLDEVRRTSFDGAISLELSVYRYLQEPKELVAMLRKSREYVEARLTAPRHLEKGLPRT